MGGVADGDFWSPSGDGSRGECGFLQGQRHSHVSPQEWGRMCVCGWGQSDDESHIAQYA